MAVLFPRWDVETGTLADHFDVDVSGHTTISTTRSHSTSKSIKYDSETGSDTTTCSFPSNPTTVFAEWWWYLETTAETGNGSGNHCFRFCQEGNGNLQEREVDCFPKNGQLRIDILDHVSGYDSSNQLHDIASLPSGQWFKFQILVILATGTSSNGTIKVWINDSLAFSKTNQQFSTGSSWTKFNIWELTTNWESGTALWYMDDIYASTVDESGGADTTAPTLTSATAGTPNSTGTTGAGVTTDEGNGTLYWAVVTNGGSCTDAQLKAGGGGNIVAGKASNQPVTTGGAQTIAAITGLSVSTTYQIKFLHRDAAGNDSSQSSVGLTTTATDTTAPVLSSPNAGTRDSYGTVGARVVTDEGNGTLYWAVVTNGGSCTDAQLKAGTGGNIVAGQANNQVVNATGTQTIATITALDPSTTYQIKFLHRDAAGNDSSQASVSLTTLAPPTGVIWTDGFETDLSGDYYERNNPSAPATWGRATTAAFTGSWALKSLANTSSGNNTSNWWLGFGKLPTVTSWPVFANATGTSTTAIYTDVSVSFRHMASAWTPSVGAIKLMRISVFSGSTGAQAAVLHLWSYSDAGTAGNNERLLLDPASGVSGSTVVTTEWNDIANLNFLGSSPCTTHVYSQSNLNHWFLIKVRMKLNTPGLSNGIMELWIDGVREVNVTNLNYIGSWTPTFGINTVHLERYWNDGAPGNDISYFDDLSIVDNNAPTGSRFYSMAYARTLV